MTDEIRALIAQGLSNKEIAESVGCRDAYVRVVRQRDAGRDPNKKYQRKLEDEARANAAIRAAANEAKRKEYHELRRDYGLSPRQATNKSASAYFYTLRRLAVKARKSAA